MHLCAGDRNGTSSWGLWPDRQCAGLSTAPLASRLRGAGGGAVDNPCAQPEEFKTGLLRLSFPSAHKRTLRSASGDTHHSSQVAAGGGGTCARGLLHASRQWGVHRRRAPRDRRHAAAGRSLAVHRQRRAGAAVCRVTEGADLTGAVAAHRPSFGAGLGACVARAANAQRAERRHTGGGRMCGGHAGSTRLPCNTEDSATANCKCRPCASAR